jgi:hypothetical protein
MTCPQGGREDAWPTGPVAVAAGLSVVHGGLGGMRGQAGVGGVGLAARSPARALGSAGFHHGLPGGQQHPEQAGAV